MFTSRSVAPPYYSTATGKEGFPPLTPLSVMLITSTILFIASLLVGLWAAYDLGTALLRFGFLSTGLGFMFATAWVGRDHAKMVLGLVGIGCAVWAAGLSIAYGLHFNTNSGAVASGLMVLLPLAASGVWWQWMRRRWVLVWAGSGALALAGIALLLTLERTAWIGLALGVGGASYLYWRRSPVADSHVAIRSVVDWCIALGLVGGIVLHSLLLLTPTMDGFVNNSGIGAALLERVDLWRESLAVAYEYYFTGSGLGMTPMVYSTYVFSMHTPYWYHAHHLYLQIALEQGVPGLLAYLGMNGAALGMMLTTYRQSGPYSRWVCLATMTALVASLSYGFLDAELYSTSTVTVLFIPVGFALALYWSQHNHQHSHQHSLAQTLRVRSRFSARTGVGIMPVIALAALCLGVGPVERFYTNLAVLTQTKVELTRYHWPLWPLQDALRRTEAVDLSTAIGYYQQLLMLNPNNPTAHQRLGQIALSQGDYPAALAHLTAAYEVTPARSSLHRLLGEAYAVTGNIDQAVVLWQSIDLRHAEIEDRLWWYGSLNAKQEVSRLRQAFARIQPRTER